MKKNTTTVVNFILDRSGSMDLVKSATISGFNEYINGLKKSKKGKMLFSLNTFDTDALGDLSIQNIYHNTSIREIAPLNNDSYCPRGGTPLYDASVKIIEDLSAEVDKMEIKPAVLVAIMTDGEENASKEHGSDCLKDLIKKLEKEGNYTFVYLGANQDSWTVAQKFGIKAGNIANWAADNEGTLRAYKGLAQSTVMYASAMADNSDRGVALNSASFFNKDKGGVL